MKLIIIIALAISMAYNMHIGTNFYAHTSVRQIVQNTTHLRLDYPNYVYYSDANNHSYIEVNGTCMRFTIPYSPIYDWMNRAQKIRPCHYGDLIKNGNNTACVQIIDGWIWPMQIWGEVNETVEIFAYNDSVNYHMKCNI